MLIVAAHAHLPRIVHARQHPAAYAAVGAGRSDGLHQEASARASSCWLPTHTLPFFHFHRPGAYRLFTAVARPAVAQADPLFVQRERSPPARRRRPLTARVTARYRAAWLAVVRGVDPDRQSGTGQSAAPLSGRRSPPAPGWRQGRIPPATAGMGSSPSGNVSSQQQLRLTTQLVALHRLVRLVAVHEGAEQRQTLRIVEGGLPLALVAVDDPGHLLLQLLANAETILQHHLPQIGRRRPPGYPSRCWSAAGDRRYGYRTSADDRCCGSASLRRDRWQTGRRDAVSSRRCRRRTDSSLYRWQSLRYLSPGLRRIRGVQPETAILILCGARSPL